MMYKCAGMVKMKSGKRRKCKGMASRKGGYCPAHRRKR